MIKNFDTLENYLEETIELSFGELDEDRAKEYAIGHIDCFMTWLIKHHFTTWDNGIISPILQEKETAKSLLLTYCAGRFTSENLKEEIIPFIEDRYASYRMKYEKIVATILKKLPLEFSLTIEDYQKIVHIIEEEYLDYAKCNHINVMDINIKKDIDVEEGISLFEKEDYEGAFRILKDNKSEIAFFKLGYMYLKGLGVKKDTKLAKEFFNLSIEQDHIQNLMEYAHLCLTKEISTGPSGPTHFMLYQRASDLGHMEATLKLADLYYENEKNSTAGKGIELYLKAARGGNAYAKSKAGICYLNEIGVPRNNRRGFKWLQKAAEQGEEKNLYLEPLAKCYALGLGVQINIEEAIMLYEESYQEFQDAKAAYALGRYYLEHEEEKGLEFIKEAKELGVREAITYYANLLFIGKFITQNIEEAIILYKKASDLEEPEASYMLGHCYEMGIIDEKDLKLAFNYYRKAANLDHLKALAKIGFLYELGIGTNKDSARAKNCYERALALGDEKVNFDLEFLILINPLNREKQDRVKEALNYIQQNTDNIHVQYRLGLCYKEGVGLAEDLDEAIKYLTLVAKENYLNGRELLKEVKLKKLS